MMTPEQMKAHIKRMCTDKQVFSTKRVAKEAAVKYLRGGAKPLIPYQCPLCAKFHLTTKKKG